MLCISRTRAKIVSDGLNLTWRKPLNGANPVPGPIIMIGTLLSAGSLKFDCRTKIGAVLQERLSSRGTAF